MPEKSWKQRVQFAKLTAAIAVVLQKTSEGLAVIYDDPKPGENLMDRHIVKSYLANQPRIQRKRSREAKKLIETARTELKRLIDTGPSKIK